MEVMEIQIHRKGWGEYSPERKMAKKNYKRKGKRRESPPWGNWRGQANICYNVFEKMRRANMQLQESKPQPTGYRKGN